MRLFIKLSRIAGVAISCIWHFPLGLRLPLSCRLRTGDVLARKAPHPQAPSPKVREGASTSLRSGFTQQTTAQVAAYLPEIAL